MAVPEEECSSSSPSSSSAAPSASGPQRYLAKCVLRGSAVLHVLYARLCSTSSFDLVFAKETSIELVVIGEDGIVQSICDQPVFGTIKDIAVVPGTAGEPLTQGKDRLVVISDSGKLTFLSFCSEMRRFFPLMHVPLSSPGNSRHLLGRMLAVDSSGSFVATSAYEDRLALFSLSSSGGSDVIDKRIIYPPENEGNVNIDRSVQRSSISGTIWSMCFISRNSSHPSKEHNPVLAIILNRKGALLNELLLVGWDIREEAVNVISQYVEAGPLAHHIVEVPNSNGFAFLFRVGDALLMDLRDSHNPFCVYRTSLNFFPSSVEEPNFVEEPYRVHDVDDDGLFNVAACALLELRDYDPMCIDGEGGNASSSSNCVCSWSWEPDHNKNPRMIFCIDTGEFFMIEISFDHIDPKVNLSDCLHKGLPCKELLWVQGGFLAALVDMGDGVVLKVENERLVYTSTIQNVAPILDMSTVDCHDEKHDQTFACCGVAPEGSLRIIRSGISVEKLLRTSPIYQGVTGTWTVRMKVTDLYHSFLVLSFVEETRVLSVGLSFCDVTDSVGFQPDVCTLACGLFDDGLLVQIHQNAVRLCSPTEVAHAGGVPFSSPVCSSWFPNNISISLGAVGHNLIVVSTSNPCFLYVLGVRLLSDYHYEIFEMQHLRLLNELSCISIPSKQLEQRQPSSINLVDDGGHAAAIPVGLDIDNVFVIGTYKPSVEIVSFVPDEGLSVLALGMITVTSTLGTALSGCVPQDVRLVLADQFYILCGLRNGMLLRFEWPSLSSTNSLQPPSHGCTFGSFMVNSNTGLPNADAIYFESQTCALDLMDKTADDDPVNLQLISTRRIGITPVFLVPLRDSLDTDMIALSDRPWLLQTARHSLSYTSISFQPSTHATPVSSAECPKGIIFVAENSLHLVEMVHSKRLNVQKFHIGGTPRKVLYHNESKLLLVMRNELCDDICSSDICCVDPVSGSILSSFKLEPGEVGKSMELVRARNEQVLVIGTSLTTGPAIMPSGEAESAKGRLIVLYLEPVKNSDSGSVTFSSKAGSSSQRASPFPEIAGYTTEQLSSSSLCSSPDDTSCDGVKLEETEAWQLRFAYATTYPGMVLAICPYLDHYFLASAGNVFYVCGFPSDNPQRVRRFAVGRTRFMITSLTAHNTRIAVGDCRDGILFYCYYEDSRKLEQLYCDPSQRLVADCLLMNVDTAVVSDRKGSIAVLSCSDRLECNPNPECNLTLNCAYYLGEIAMRLRKWSFSYKLPADDMLMGYEGLLNFDESQGTIMASTLLGSIIVLVPLSREEHKLLEAVQDSLAVHPLTAPILGNDHNEFRSRENPVGVPKILDGDMLCQFLELTSLQQEAVLALPVGSAVAAAAAKTSLKPRSPVVPVNKVVKLLERVHYALN